MKTNNNNTDPIINLLHGKLTSWGINANKDLLGLCFYFGLVVGGALLLATLKTHNII